MPGPIERWLETFMCGQFAEIFDRFGYRTLQSVCQLQIPQLMSMGIPQNESEVIYQNIQSMCHSSNNPHQQMQFRNMYYNRMSHDMPGIPGQVTPRDGSQSQMSCMPQDNSCYNYGNHNVGSSGQFYNQGMPQPADMMNSPYRQQYQGVSFSNQPQQPDRTPFPCMGMSSANSTMTSRNNYTGHVPGAQLIGHSNMRQSHPHLRNSGQNPQEVANNILHMAASSYPTNHTVQVPLSKNRSAPYHLPNRSPNYNNQSQEMGHDFNNQQQQQGQFMYPSPPHQSQMQQGVRDPRMSPVSPGSGNMCSPLSHHSGRSMPSSSPCSMHSPGIGNVRSPGPNSQMMNSPQRNSYPMASPMTAPNQRMVSPVPTSQQLQVNVPSSLTQQMPPQCYGNNNSNTMQQYQSHPQQAMAQYSPGLSACNSPGGHSGHLVQSPSAPGGTFSHSPSGQSGYCSNISSPFTPTSRASYHSPSQTHASPTVESCVPETNFNTNISSTKQCTSPLQSLQKLCMLPESQVVDPKSVVKEACSSSPAAPAEGNQNISDNSSVSCVNMDGNQSWNNFDKKPADTEFPVISEQTEQPPSNTCSESVISPDRCQPKKMMLLRAAKEDFSSSNQGNSDIPVSHQASFSNSNIASSSSRYIQQQNVDTAPNNDCNNVTDQVNEIRDNVNDVSNRTEGGPTESNHETASLNYNNTSINNETSNLIIKSIEKSNVLLETNKLETSESSCLNVLLENNKESMACNSAMDSIDSSLREKSNLNQDCESETLIKETDCGVCLKDTGADNVQLNGNDDKEVTENVQSDEQPVSAVSDCSVSDHESHLVVRKDIQNTYSKQGLKSFEITPRQRGDSTGSLSDDLVNSDFEYEDHIGCDDIETGYSDIDEKANDMDESTSERTKAVDSDMSSGVVVIEKIGHSAWQKGNLKGRVSKKKNKNGHVNGVTNFSDFGLENIPSPLGGDVVDGIDEPISVDMGDGTVSISRPSRIRQRKTPVKYKDTSFFQGDFVFIEEEQQQNSTVSKKRNTTKRTDLNYNSKKSSEKTAKNKNKSVAHVETKDANTADKKDSEDLPKPPEIKAVVELSPNQNLEKTLKVLAEQHDKLKNENHDKRNVKLCVITKDNNGHLTSEVIHDLHDVTTDSCVKESVLNAGSKSCSKVTKSQSKQPAGQRNKSPATRNSAKRSRSNESVSDIANKRSKQEQVNGIKSETPCESKTKTVTRSKRNNVVSHDNGDAKVKSKTNKKDLNAENDFEVVENNKAEFKSKSSKKGTKSENIEAKPNISTSRSDSDFEVIEIISDNEVGSEKDSGAKCKGDNDKKSLVQPKYMNCVKKEENFNDSVFSFLDDDGDDVVVKEASDDDYKPDLKVEKKDKIINVPKSSGKVSSVKRTSSKSVVKNVKPKKKVNRSKRKSLEYDDPDFELGQSLKFLKSGGSSDNLNNKKAKKKTDKWADFKGPKIVFEGDKETPDKCAVINDPYEQTCSKKAKLITQNVTRIEISQLPPDKSVLIPNSDSLDSGIWKCALCGKHSSYKFLGDLFGPYTVETMSEDMLDLSPKILAGSSKGRGGKRSDSSLRDVSEWKEVWVHESCAVYSDGVFLIGSKIYGLQEAVRIASQTLCSVCDTLGAMIGCLNKGCQQKFHHVCAQEADCYLDEENFSLLCPKHKVKKLKQLEASAAMNTG